MKTKYIGVVAMLALFGFVEPSSAEGGSWGVPAGETMKAQAGLVFAAQGFSLCYDFTFRLREDSDGIYPDSELVEIEIPGELNPDGSRGSAFVISVPIGSFSLGGLWNKKHPFFHLYNPPGLKVSQYYKSNIFDFVETDGPFIYPHPSAPGVTSFWGLIIQRGEGKGITMRIRIRMRDSRPNELQQAPNFVELVHGSPTLRIGNDEWKSYLYIPYSSDPYRPPGDYEDWFRLHVLNWQCSSFFKATYYD